MKSVFAILVAFKVDVDHSIYYRKCSSLEELKHALEIAARRKADFVSIRFPRKEEQITEYENNTKLEKFI